MARRRTKSASMSLVRARRRAIARNRAVTRQLVGRKFTPSLERQEAARKAALANG